MNQYFPRKKRSLLDEFIYSLSNGGFKPNIKDVAVTGHFYDPSTKRKVSRLINNLIINNRNSKIGATGDAQIRTDYNDYRQNYFDMHLVYKSRSANYVADMEVHFITKFWGKTDNKHQVRTNRLKSHDGYFYLYVVTS